MTPDTHTARLERALLMHMPMDSGANVATRKAAQDALGIEDIPSMDRLIAFAEARGYDPYDLWPEIMRLRATPEAQALSQRRF